MEVNKVANDYISQVTLPNNTTYDFKDQNLKLYTGSCSTAAGTAIKDVTTDGAFTLAKGAVIFVNFSVTNSATVGNLKLKINGEADANAKPIKYLVNGNDPANIPGAGYLRANQTYMFRYDGTNWVADLNYYTYSNDFANKIGHYNNILARKLITAESLIVGDETGYEKVASGVTFNLAYPIVWCTAKVEAASSNYNAMFLQHYDRNIATGAKTGFTSTANKVIYLIVTVNDNIATIDSNIITDTLPSSADGKVYISLGKLGAQSTGANYFFLYPTHPMFEYKNGKIRTYEAQQSLNEIDDADDLKAIEALSGTSGFLKKTAANTWILDTPVLTNVSYTAATDNNEYPILLKNSTGSDTTAAGVKFANTTNKMTTINPSTGMITAPSLTLASNAAIAHLAFARAGWNYVTMPNNDSSVISIGYGTPADNTTQRLVIYKTGTVRPGANGSQNLGDDSHKWNKVYGVNFYGTFNGTATSAQQLAAREIDNSDLNSFNSGGALKYAWVGGGNSILSKPTSVNAFGVIVMKTATNWTGQLLMSTDSEPGLYWRTNLTTETPSYGSWTPLASGNGGVYYGTCATAADVVEKVVVCKHYHTLKAGDIIVVTFTNSNTQAQPTLNVNNTGAVSVKMAYSGGIVDLGSTSQLRFTCTFIYDGTYWLIINQQNAIQLATSDGNLNWRSVLLSDSNSINENFTPTANTLGRTYAAHNVKYQPSTGTLRAPIMKTPKVQIEYDHVNKAHIEWNDTDSSIDFIFD